MSGVTNREKILSQDNESAVFFQTVYAVLEYALVNWLRTRRQNRLLGEVDQVGARSLWVTREMNE